MRAGLTLPCILPCATHDERDCPRGVHRYAFRVVELSGRPESIRRPIDSTAREGRDEARGQVDAADEVVVTVRLQRGRGRGGGREEGGEMGRGHR